MGYGLPDGHVRRTDGFSERGPKALGLDAARILESVG